MNFIQEELHSKPSERLVKLTFVTFLLVNLIRFVILLLNLSLNTVQTQTCLLMKPLMLLWRLTVR
ncbi:hypothetical protein Goklo_006392 [Gossypium klotzschianum]|uniref:Uncharacterized protein n=1 Tax=Gossypium klotzschianum TaxID=34286 RepID=A0A7J8VI23_9ROSI|nr:hypothetical protein [Gossypium klotzschianum]